jgi:uncharacterized protein (TIGR02246 family)
MRTVLFIAVMLAACATAPPPQSSPTPISELAAEDLREVNGIFEQWERAWQAHDMHAWAQLFHEDGTYVTWFGDVLVGRNAIENAMVQAHRTVFQNSVQLSRPEEIKLVAPGVVVARSFTTLTGDAREPQSTIYGRKIVVITEREGRWKILYGQAVRLSGRAAEAVRQQGP